jgi:tetratricopeptide (TPR) repeat protein
MLPLLSILLALPLAAQGRVVQVDGTSVSGTITTATLEKIEVQVGEQSQTIAPDQVLRLSFGTPPSVILQAQGFLDRLEFQNAVSLLDEAAGQADPAWIAPYAKILRAEALLAWSNFDANRASEAVQGFNEWLASYPDHFWVSRARIGKALAMGRTGKVSDAAKELQAVASFAFENNLGKKIEFEARLARCEVYLQGKDAALARQRLEGSGGLVANLKEAASSPQAPTGLRSLLTAYWVRAQIQLGDALEQTDGLGQAKSYWERLLRSERNLGDDARASGKIVIARAARDAGKLREAQFALAEIAATINAGPETMARALYTLGEVCQELGDKPTPGTTYFRRIVERFPSSSWAQKARKKLGK